MQNSFFVLWRKAAKLELVGDPALPWLIGVCRLECRTIHARETKKRTEPLDGETTIAAAGPKVDEHVINLVLIEQLNALVAGLTETDKAIYELCLLDDYSYEGAAQKLCITHGAVRNRLSRLRKSLQRRLGPQFKEESP